MDKQNERILKIIDYFCGGNKAEFGRRVDEIPQTINGWLKRDNSPKVLNKILTAFPEVSPAWLQLGEGEMLINPNQDQANTKENLMDKLIHWRSLAIGQQETMTKLAETILKQQATIDRLLNETRKEKIV